MASTPYTRFFWSDWIADTSHLDLMQLGAYMRLLEYIYQHGKPLPGNPHKIFRICHATSATEQKTIEETLEEYFFLFDDPEYGKQWRHARAEKEIEWSAEASRKNVDKAKNAAAVRWGNDRKKEILGSGLEEYKGKSQEVSGLELNGVNPSRTREFTNEETGSDAPSNAPSNAQAYPQAMLERCQPEPEPEPELEPELEPQPKPKPKDLKGTSKEKEKTPRAKKSSPARQVPKKSTAPNFNAWPQAPDPEQWAEILVFRKKKKASNTQRAYDNLGKKLHAGLAAGYTFAECMDAWESRQWAGFNSLWMDQKGRGKNGVNGSGYKPICDHNNDVARDYLAGITGKNTTPAGTAGTILEGVFTHEH